ncbi:hypothetical protein Emag_005865 [Eimeria magna]
MAPLARRVAPLVIRNRGVRPQRVSVWADDPGLVRIGKRGELQSAPITCPLLAPGLPMQLQVEAPPVLGSAVSTALTVRGANRTLRVAVKAQPAAVSFSCPSSLSFGPTLVGEEQRFEVPVTNTSPCLLGIHLELRPPFSAAVQQMLQQQLLHLSITPPSLSLEPFTSGRFSVVLRISCSGDVQLALCVVGKKLQRPHSCPRVSLQAAASSPTESQPKSPRRRKKPQQKGNAHTAHYSGQGPTVEGPLQLRATCTLPRLSLTENGCSLQLIDFGMAYCGEQRRTRLEATNLSSLPLTLAFAASSSPLSFPTLPNGEQGIRQTAHQQQLTPLQQQQQHEQQDSLLSPVCIAGDLASSGNRRIRSSVGGFIGAASCIARDEALSCGGCPGAAASQQQGAAAAPGSTSAGGAACFPPLNCTLTVPDERACASLHACSQEKTGFFPDCSGGAARSLEPLNAATLASRESAEGGDDAWATCNDSKPWARGLPLSSKGPHDNAASHAPSSAGSEETDAKASSPNCIAAETLAHAAGPYVRQAKLRKMWAAASTPEATQVSSTSASNHQQRHKASDSKSTAAVAEQQQQQQQQQRQQQHRTGGADTWQQQGRLTARALREPLVKASREPARRRRPQRKSHSRGAPQQGPMSGSSEAAASGCSSAREVGAPLAPAAAAAAAAAKEAAAGTSGASGDVESSVEQPGGQAGSALSVSSFAERQKGLMGLLRGDPRCLCRLEVEPDWVLLPPLETASIVLTLQTHPCELHVGFQHRQDQRAVQLPVTFELHVLCAAEAAAASSASPAAPLRINSKEIKPCFLSTPLCMRTPYKANNDSCLKPMPAPTRRNSLALTKASSPAFLASLRGPRQQQQHQQQQLSPRNRGALTARGPVMPSKGRPIVARLRPATACGAVNRSGPRCVERQAACLSFSTPPQPFRLYASQQQQQQQQEQQQQQQQQQLFALAGPYGGPAVSAYPQGPPEGGGPLPVLCATPTVGCPPFGCCGERSSAGFQALQQLLLERRPPPLGNNFLHHLVAGRCVLCLPDLEVTPLALHFEDCFIGDRQEKQLILLNPHQQLPLDVSLEASHPFRCEPAACQLLPRQQLAVKISFAPQRLGPVTQRLTVSFCKRLYTRTVCLRGKALRGGFESPRQFKAHQKQQRQTAPETMNALAPSKEQQQQQQQQSQQH